ncbi:MAG: DNA-binding transcriptional regulator [Verrucomicrobia bacterium]|nr:DNA-binding transcriptional regulator [Verrucomicrobiota bacterium]
MPKPPKRRHVALLTAGWNQYGRGIIEGAWNFAQHNAWNLDMQPSAPDGSLQMPAGWRGDGIIATVHSSTLGAELAGYGVPVVNVSGSRLPGVDFPRVTSDADAVVALAIEHLRSKGLRNIAYCGEPQRGFLQFWTDAYVRVSATVGLRPLIYQPAPRLGSNAGVEARRRDRARWLQRLPLPVGVIGWDTITCRHVASACELAGRQIPDQVAIISLSTEDLLGQTIHPPISGVDIPVKRIGYEAASLLEQLIRGRRPPSREVLLQPLGITTRQSTDLFECADPKIRQAMRFIRDQAVTGINVRDVLRAVPMGRRTLERGFAELIGHSPAEEIRRTKLEKVRQLLTATDLAVPDIAEACGFAYAEHMIPLFARHHGCTPAAFRRNVRGTSPVPAALVPGRRR